MANNRLPKKAAGKKAVSKGRVVKKTTLPKGKSNKPSKAEINSRRLAADMNYYNEQNPYNDQKLVRSSKDSRGIQIGKLLETYNDKGEVVGYHSKDNSVRISVYEFNKIRANPRAAIVYIPVHNKEGKIVRYRNSYTGELVTPYYRHQVYGKKIRDIKEPADVSRLEVYQASLSARRHQDRQRHYNLIDSYVLTLNEQEFKDEHGKKWRKVIAQDEQFTDLVYELESFSSQQHSITEEYWGTAMGIMGMYPDEEEVKEQTLTVRRELGKQPAYQQVLVDLGRRLPADEFPVGDSPTSHIKLDVKPFYESMFGIEYKEGEDDSE